MLQQAEQSKALVTLQTDTLGPLNPHAVQWLQASNLIASNGQKQAAALQPDWVSKEMHSGSGKLITSICLISLNFTLMKKALHSLIYAITPKMWNTSSAKWAGPAPEWIINLCTWNNLSYSMGSCVWFNSAHSAERAFHDVIPWSLSIATCNITYMSTQPEITQCWVRAWTRCSVVGKQMESTAKREIEEVELRGSALKREKGGKCC